MKEQEATKLSPLGTFLPAYAAQRIHIIIGDLAPLEFEKELNKVSGSYLITTPNHASEKNHTPTKSSKALQKSLMFKPYLNKWNLLSDGAPIITRSSYLLPVRMDGYINGRPAILKIAIDTEEKFGGLVMQWWNGDGAAQVYAYEGDALLMERAQRVDL